MASNSAHKSVSHDRVLPPPVSVKNLLSKRLAGVFISLKRNWRSAYACLPILRSDVAKLFKLSTPFVVHSACVPLPSESRYWWTSKTRPVLLPSGLVTVLRAAADPSETKAPREVYMVPGSKTVCLFAPAQRIAVTAAWTEVDHVVMSRS